MVTCRLAAWHSLVLLLLINLLPADWSRAACTSDGHLKAQDLQACHVGSGIRNLPYQKRQSVHNRCLQSI
jgi:hypothetical protein